MDVQLDSLVLKVNRSVGLERGGILPRNDVTCTQMHMEVVGLRGQLLESATDTTRVRIEARVLSKFVVEDIAPATATEEEVVGILAKLIGHHG